MSSWADDHVEENNHAEEDNDQGWETVITKTKIPLSSKPVHFGYGIPQFQTFQIKHPCSLFMLLKRTKGMLSDLHVFHSVYHYIQYLKVYHYGTNDQLKAILDLTDATPKINQEIHKISGSLAKFNKSEWEEIELKALHGAFVTKASQNKEFRKELLSTQNREIILHGVKWWGVTKNSQENVMGKILETVREQIKKEEL